MSKLINISFLVIGIAILSAFRINSKSSALISPGFKVVKTWHLPHVLKEISGITVIDSVRFGCIQDEIGSIFIYNIVTSKIEKEIPFASAGDYEGIAMVNNTFWVVRSDGKLFEITTLNYKLASVKEHSTPLSVKHNVEGLCYDKKNNRLLLAIKNGDPGIKTYKGIYSFNLTTNIMSPSPVYKINIQQDAVAGNRKKSFKIMPSDLAIHPINSDIYVTDGRNSIIMVLDADGSFKKLYTLGNEGFHKPEGIAFTSAGEMYISNEGKMKGGTIVKVQAITE